MKNAHISLIIITFSVIVLAVAGAFINENDTNSIYITEICPKNDVNAYDDKGNYGADYIELYNASDKAICLKGYSIIGNSVKKTRYKLKNYTIEAHSTIMVWSDSNDDLPSEYLDTYTIRDIHNLPFGIKLGESISLCNSRGTIVQTVTLPNEMAEDNVYSSTLEDLSSFYITNSTPYFVENRRIEETSSNCFVKSPTFSIDSGWYTNDLELYLSSEEGDIYYTLDGSLPTKNSIKYNGEPIHLSNASKQANKYSSIENISVFDSFVPNYNVDKANVVRAITINGDSTSEVVSKTYFVGLDDNEEYDDISIIEITMDPDDLFDYYNGIYVKGFVYDIYSSKHDVSELSDDSILFYSNYAKKGKGWERKAYIEYYDINHQRLLSQKVGIRIFGSYSTNSNQKSFKIFSRAEYDGNEKFLYNFFGKTVNKINLRAGGGSVHSTKLNDIFNQALVNDRDVTIQNYEKCQVFLNGEYWGMYNIQDCICEDFISETYNVSRENILIYKNRVTNIENGENIYDEIIDYVRTSNMKLESSYEKIKEIVDIQSYIDYMAIEIYSANSDSLNNNYACWRTIKQENDVYGDTKWRWILFDLDGSSTNYDYDTISSKYYLGEDEDILFSSLLKNDGFKKDFVTSFMDIANSNYKYETVHDALDAISKEYKKYVISSHKRFVGSEDGMPYSDEKYSIEYDSGIENIDYFFLNRFNYATAYLKDNLELNGELYQIKVNSNKQKDVKLSINTIKEISDGWTGYYYSDYPITINCNVNDECKFLRWEDAEGNLLSTDNEYTFALNDNISIIAIVE